MGPTSTSPRALHGWALEASSCSFRSCWVGTSVVRVLSWAKPCSASWDLRVVCFWRSLLSDVRFFGEKVHSLSVAPEPLAVWNKELEGLESDWNLTENFSCCGSLPFARWGCMVAVGYKCCMFTGCTVLVYSSEYARFRVLCLSLLLLSPVFSLCPL